MAEIVNIFKFLKEYNEISNPIVSEIDRQKWKLSLEDLPDIDEIHNSFQKEDIENQVVLEVKRPDLLPCPEPPKEIEDWIVGKWKDINVKDIGYREKTSEEVFNEDEELEYMEVLFEDDEDRVYQYNAWLLQRNLWQIEQMPKREGLDIYNLLYKLYSVIKKESESVELMIGNGLLSWRLGSGRIIDHPVLLQRVNIEFDTEKPSFKIVCEEFKSELYTPLLRLIPDFNHSLISDIVNELEEKGYIITDLQKTKEYFRRLIAVVSSEGKYSDIQVALGDYPVIRNCPILFLRKRTLGFSSLIEGIIEDIAETSLESVPEFFGPISGVYKEQEKKVTFEESWNSNGLDRDVLLTLPANSEQLQIIKYLEAYGSVLVQGPPGTGKTHTIANLIGHLLSQGLSVLVTSHTEKALTVLKDKVYKDLQSLCLSVLSSKSQRKEMDAALFDIAEKSTTINKSESANKIKRLEDVRKILLEKLQKKQGELLEIRSIEYKDLVVENQTINPIEGAKFVKDNKGILDYLPGPALDDRSNLPLSIEELRELYWTNGKITGEEEDILECPLPRLENLWRIDYFEDRIKEYNSVVCSIVEWKKGFWSFGDCDIDLIQEIIAYLKDIEEKLKGFDRLSLGLINIGVKDKVKRRIWEEVIADISAFMTKSDGYKKLSFDYDIIIPQDMINADTYGHIKEIIDSLDEAIVLGKLSFVTKPKWKKIKDSIIINGKKCHRKSDFSIVADVIDYYIHRYSLENKLKKLYKDIDVSHELPTEGFDDYVRKYKDIYIGLLDWFESNWTKIIFSLTKAAFDFEGYYTMINGTNPRKEGVELFFQVIEGGLIDILQNKILIEKEKMFKTEFNKYILSLDSYGTTEIIAEILQAIKKKDIEIYKKTYGRFIHLVNKQDIHQKRRAYLKKLDKVSPKWARAIMNREGIHGLATIPDRLQDAWKWRQLFDQINRINSIDINKIQQEILSLTEQLMENSRLLAVERAWLLKVVNMTTQQEQAIGGWRQTMKQIGKGTGKNAPMLWAEARRLMPLCQTAIPVWIMPLSKVAESFDPKNNKFDVVIIDEASQADILALGVLYLGKKIIVVGDDEQVSPDAVGINTDEINALIDQHLNNIPNRLLFNAKTSIYDIARNSGFKSLMLTEHFRCLPEIISFSNHLSYNGRVKPLRDASKVSVYPPVIEYRVPSATIDRKVNTVEAEHIASLIITAIENEKYKDKTIGVISLLGHEQAYHIDSLLQTYLDPKEYERRRIQCGTPPQFQGDERDIIFLSMVYGPQERGGPLRMIAEEGNNDLYRKRYNVAASRAKEQMWVVHSLNPELDLKSEDIRLRLIKHARNPKALEKDIEGVSQKAESEFEKQVLKRLVEKGYKTISQWEVGAYRIDIVVQYGQRRVALECDGEKWHTIDDLPNDLKRQAILERLGWRFIRIRGSAFYSDPEGAMEDVYAQLKNYEIYPSNDDVVEVDLSRQELINEIKTRADQVRREWQGEDEDGAESDSKEDALNTDLEEGIYKAEIAVGPESQDAMPMPKEYDVLKYEEKSEAVTINEDSLVIDVEQKAITKKDIKSTSPVGKIEDKKERKNQPKESNRVRTNTNNTNSTEGPRFDFRNQERPGKNNEETVKGNNPQPPKFDFTNRKG